MSSYNAPLPVGSPEGTGAAQVAIAANPAGINNNGNTTDSAGNVQVDFTWGTRPMQPNDVRTDGGTTVVVAADADQNYDWSGYSVFNSARLDASLNQHALAEAGWSGYPSYTPGVGNYMITAVSGDGTTVTYTAQNKLAAGDVVNVTGLTVSAYNLSSATVATADVLSFTVTNAANAGLITGQRGKVEDTTALTDYDGVGIGNILVPNVLGATTAIALDTLRDAGYEAASITTASAAANAVSTITAVARTAAVATITSTGAGAKYPVGTKITVASLAAPDTALNGTFTVTAVTADTVSYTTTTSGTLSTAELSVAGLSGVAGTIKTQSTAGGTTAATTATITITPFAAVS